MVIDRRTGRATGPAQQPVFPGGTSVSHLRVYDWPAPDAPGGSGTPHLHTTSTEAYVVLSGSGRVETLGPQGFASHDLVPGRIVWFTPGVIHRAVNDGGLEVLVVMSNAGLPEAGDAVLTFPPEVLASQAAYQDAVRLPRMEGEAPDGRAPGVPHPPGAEDAGPGVGAAGASGGGVRGAIGAADDMAPDPVVAAAARARRDLALAGYAVLRDAVAVGGPAALEPLYAAAARLVAGRADQWRSLWATTVAQAAADTDRALGALVELGDSPAPGRVGASGASVPGGAGASAAPVPADGTATGPVTATATGTATGPADAVVGHLLRGAVTAADARSGPRRYGMCGRLRVWSTR